MAQNGYYYLKVVQDKQVIKFSLRTKDPDVADQLYSKFLERMIDVRLDGKLSRSKSGTVSASIPIQQPEPAPTPTITSYSIESYYKQYMNGFLNGSKQVAKGTIWTKWLILKIMKSVGIVYYSDITQEKIDQLTAYLRDTSGPTKNKYFNQLRAFLNWSISRAAGEKGEDVFSNRQYQRLEFPRFEETSRDTYILPEHRQRILLQLETEISDCNHILKTLTEKNLKNYKHLATIRKHNIRRERLADLRMYLITLYNLACRPNEAQQITPDHFDFESGTAIIWQSKTKKKKTPLLIEPDFVQKIQAYISEKAFSASDHILLGHGKSDAYYSQKFSELLKRCGLDMNYTLYSYRHTAATDLVIYSKANYEFVANQLGDNPDMIRKHYNHATVQQQFGHLKKSVSA